MRFILNYSLKGIKSAKARALLIIFSVGLVSLLFFASIVLPLFIGNAIEDSVYQRVGNTDIQASTYTTGGTQNIYSMLRIEEKYGENYLEENFDYAVFTMTLVGKYKNIKGKSISIGAVGTSYEDAMKVGGIELSAGSPTTMGLNDIIITETLATENELNVNDYINVSINGTSCNLRIVGISANKGILNESSYPIILFNKKLIKSKNILTSLYKEDIFNVALFKVKDGVDKQAMADDLQAVFPKFNVGFVMSASAREQLKNTVFYVYYICAAIGVIFSVIVIFLTMNLIFSRRTQEFSRLRSMGATNKQLLGSCLFESAIYGLAGGVLSAILAAILYKILQNIQFTYKIFYGMNYWILLGPVFFGMLVSVLSGIIPAIKSTHKSVREEMVKTNTVHKRTYIISGIVAALVIAGIVILSIYDIGVYPLLSLASFFVILLGAMYLIPLVISLLVKLVIKCFRKKNFTTIYLDKNIYTPSTNMVTRILAFGLSFVMILSMAVATVMQQAYAYAYDSRFNAYIEGRSAYTQADVDYVKGIDGVEDAYETVVFSNLSTGEDNSVIYANYAFTPELLERLYKDDLIDADEVIAKFKTTKNAVVVNKARYYIDNMRIGDTVSIRFNLNDSFVSEFEVVGFYDSLEDSYASVVFRIDYAKELATQYGGSYRLAMIIDHDKYTNIQNELNEHFLTKDESLTSMQKRDDLDYSSITSPMILVRGYMGMVIILCAICIVVGMCLSLRESTKQSKILYQLGMSKRRFLFTLMAEISVITIMSAVVGGLITMLLQQNMSKVIIFAKVYVSGIFNIPEMVLLAIGIAALNLGLSVYLTKYLFNKISQNAKINFNDD